METALAPIKAALEDMTDAELKALIDATYKAEQIAPGLLACSSKSCDWERNRRAGYDFESCGCCVVAIVATRRNGLGRAAIAADHSDA